MYVFLCIYCMFVIAEKPTITLIHIYSYFYTSYLVSLSILKKNKIDNDNRFAKTWLEFVRGNDMR